jgi:putative membrane protein
MRTLALIAAAGLCGVAASAQTPPPPPPAAAKAQAPAYVTAAGKSDLFEIDSSRIAVRKTKNPQVRQFAQMLIDHHQKTTAATVSAARTARVPAPPPRLDPGAATSIRELERASAADFDRLYLGQQVPAHQAALDLHTAYSQGGDKAELKASAASAVPIVQSHLDTAQRLSSGTGM